MRKITSAILSLLVFTGVAANAQTLRIDVQGVAKPTPVAIVPFGWEGDAPDMPLDVAEIIKADLEHSKVSSKYSEEISELGEVISELEHIKQQPLKALAKANETRSTKAKLDHAQWQAWAELVFAEHPTWNKSGVALHIIEEHKIKAAVGTVADKLKKPVSD